jgi:hypothetical protein
VETDGAGVAFQGVGDGPQINGNKIGLGAGVWGIRVENGFSFGQAQNNDFYVTDGSSEPNARLKAISILGSNWQVDGNTWHSERRWSSNPSGTVLVVPELYDEISISNSNPTISTFTTSTWDGYKDKIPWTLVTAGGSGYTSAPTVVFTGGGGTGAAGTAYIDQSGAVLGIRMTNYGSGYTSAPAVSFTGGGGSGAAATAQFQVPPQRRRFWLHCLNGATLTSGGYPAFSLPAGGGVISNGREIRVRNLFSTNYLDY